jgi:large subunit ribosomal protein L31
VVWDVLRSDCARGFGGLNSLCRVWDSIVLLPPILLTMKEGIHPDNYRTVIFKDLTAEWRFLGKSCAESKETEQWDDGNEYPIIKVEVSSASHPFYTGKNTLVDTAGRIDKFRTRYAKHKKK